MEREALWRSVVETKHDNTRGEWCSKEVVRLFGEGVWNPSTQEVYKISPKMRKKNSINLKTLQK
jgi:hypothetical protein